MTTMKQVVTMMRFTQPCTFTGETGSSTSISTSPSLSELYILVFNVVLGVQG